MSTVVVLNLPQHVATSRGVCVWVCGGAGGYTKGKGRGGGGLKISYAEDEGGGGHTQFSGKVFMW